MSLNFKCFISLIFSMQNIMKAEEMHENFSESFIGRYSHLVGWWIAVTSVWPLHCIVLLPIMPETPREERCARGRMPQIPIMPRWSRSRFLAPHWRLWRSATCSRDCSLTFRILHHVIAIIFVFLAQNKHCRSCNGGMHQF